MKDHRKPKRRERVTAIPDFGKRPNRADSAHD